VQAGELLSLPHGDEAVSIASTCHAGHGTVNDFLRLASLNREIWQGVVKYVYVAGRAVRLLSGDLKQCRWMHL
jgi:hypothetical protein